MFAALLKSELRQFQLLNQKARSLLISFAAFNVASPLLTLFANAYIWRQSQDLMLVGMFNASWMVGVTAAFYLNGVLMRWVSLPKLYASGLVLQGAANMLLFGVSAITFQIIIGLGLFLGLMAGIYWANRNFLIHEVTSSKERDYFSGLDSALYTLFSIASPVAFGWFLQLGEKAEELGVVERYQMLMGIVLLVQLLGAKMILRAGFHDVTPRGMFLKISTPQWQLVRKFTALKGVADGSSLFLPTLVILHLVGKEGPLGTCQSAAVLVCSVVLYGVARWMTISRRYWVLVAGVCCVAAGGIILSAWYGPIGGVIYLICQTLGVQLLWSAANPIIYDAISHNLGEDEEAYAFIVDRELFLNIGRLFGLVVSMLFIYVFGETACLRASPLALAALTAVLLGYARPLTRQE